MAVLAAFTRYAVYALLCGAVYVVGFPVGILVLLYRRRHKLFGSDTDPFVATTRSTYGFLYEVRLSTTHHEHHRGAPVVCRRLPCCCYWHRKRTRGTAMLGNATWGGLMSRKRCDLDQVYGPSAWWWEVEELVRKLFLSAVVVLIESGSPLQVRGLFQYPIGTVWQAHTQSYTDTRLQTLAHMQARTQTHTDTQTQTQLPKTCTHHNGIPWSVLASCCADVSCMHQITLAVLVSGWAHVLHAMYKPWGAGTTMYALQHGSLFVTSFVFLMVRAVMPIAAHSYCVA